MGEPRAGPNVDERGSSYYCLDADGEQRSSFGVGEDGKVGLALSAAGKGRHI